MELEKIRRAVEMTARCEEVSYWGQSPEESRWWGEVRNLPSGRTATVTSVDGARIFWTDSEGFRGRTGSALWRKFPKAA